MEDLERGYYQGLNGAVNGAVRKVWMALMGDLRRPRGALQLGVEVGGGC